MNIVEAILIERKKYIILISGFTWWWHFNEIINVLSSNLGFVVINNTSLINNQLITSSDQLNFMKLNSDVKDILNGGKKNISSDVRQGIIVVSPTFPPEKIEFPVDIHININASQTLISTLIADYIKETNIPRMDMDAHLSYLAKSWKTNKINKFVTYQQNYLEDKDTPYNIIFDTVMDNIMKKVYGEKYDQIKNKVVNPDDKKIINISDQKEPNIVDLAQINTSNNYTDFVKETISIINENDDDNEDNEDEQSETLDAKTTTDEQSEAQSAGYIKSIYIGKRKLNKILK